MKLQSLTRRRLAAAEVIFARAEKEVMAAAATRLQGTVRQWAAKKRVGALRSSNASATTASTGADMLASLLSNMGAPLSEGVAEEEEDEEAQAAATKLQSLARTRVARKSVEAKRCEKLSEDGRVKAEAMAFAKSVVVKCFNVAGASVPIGERLVEGAGPEGTS